MLNIEKLQEVASQRGIRWNHPAVGVLITTLAASIVTLPLATLFHLQTPWIFATGIGVGCAAFFVWRWTCRIPKNKPGCTGIALAIRAETEDERKRIRSDFIAAIAVNLRRDDASVRFHVVEIPSFLAPDVNDTESALKFLKESGCALLIWGRISTRKHNKAEVYSLSLEGAVTHSITAPPRSQALAQEMRHAIPAKREISLNDELREFEAASQSIALAAKYVVALAAAVSDDWAFSKALLLEVNADIGSTNGAKTRKVKGRKDDGPLIGRLRAQVPRHLAGVCNNQFGIKTREWVEDKDNLQLARAAEQLLDDARAYHNKFAPDGPEYWVPKALFEVVIRGDVKEASRLLTRCRAVALNDPVWRLSLAFVKVLQGEPLEALVLYDAAVERDVVPQTIFDVEDFIQWWLAKNKGPVELFLLSALLNAKLKNDPSVALEDLNRFDALAASGTNAAVVARAAALRRELRKFR